MWELLKVWLTMSPIGEGQGQLNFSFQINCVFYAQTMLFFVEE